ncbi:MAG: hypothetical protein VX464_20840 [Pseudomonadota bacterium]|nr:hypothetical protein [Pseudomonadota bacterium]
MGEWNNNIDSAPYGVVLEVRNGLMEAPVLATRGFTFNGAVSPNQRAFTSTYTLTPDGFFLPAGLCVIPDEWRLPSPPEDSKEGSENG